MGGVEVGFVGNTVFYFRVKLKGGKVEEKVYAPDSLQEGRISFSVKNREKSLYYCHLATISISSTPYDLSVEWECVL